MVVSTQAGQAGLAGEQLFAIYAHAPNERGYCGPTGDNPLFAVAAAAGRGEPPTPEQAATVPGLARKFSGAWPYLMILGEMLGRDPLDAEVVRAYWTGSALLDSVDAADFGARLLDYIGPQAGHYWQHLTPELLGECAPSHDFHVLAIYPWTHLLAATPGMEEHALGVLDGCRVRVGRVLAVDGDHVTVQAQRLRWQDRQLVLGEPARESVQWRTGPDHPQPGQSFIEPPQVGNVVSIHWGWACEIVDAPTAGQLERGLTAQLARTNRRWR